MALDEFQQIFHKLERRLREARVVEALADSNLRIDNKADFGEQANMEVVAAALKVAGADAIVELDEEHSSWFVRFHDSTNAVRRVDLELSHHPEFRKYRALAKQISKGNYPPFTVQKGEHRDTQPDWRSLLDHIKAEGKRDASVQRYKGLGEMNAEQLADTTMDPDKRTMLSVRVEDLVATDLIFTTLMGEDVENRRRFIEDNALDVKNLDV